MEPATIVIDNGTGYTKMGYSGNFEPSYMIPSVISNKIKAANQQSQRENASFRNPELDFYIGDEALSAPMQ